MMNSNKTKTWTLVAIIGMAQWFFGNFYEAIVLAPNMLYHSSEQLQRWHEYFTVTNQIYYYVPFTQIAVLLVWFLYWKQKDRKVKSRLLIASIFGSLSLLITAYIIINLNLKLFFGDISKYGNSLSTMTLQWNIFNLIRVCLVGATLVHTFKAYSRMINLHRQLERER